MQKLLGENFGEFLDVSQAETPAHLRILRVKAKGKDNEVPVRWFYYLVSDPEGRQVTFCLSGRGETAGSNSAGPTSSSSIRSVSWRRS